MKYVHDILLRPVITEKAARLMEGRQYVFEVDPRANKIEIRKAVEKIFKDVHVAKVHTLRIQGKIKRHGRFSGRRPLRKRAIVTLTPNSKSIELMEA